MSDDVQEVDVNIPQDEAEADALIAEAQASEVKGGPIEDAPAAPPESVWDGKSWAINVGGKEAIPESRDQLIAWAQRGYNAPVKIRELQTQLDQWKSKEAQLNELHGKYNEIDDYVRKNPQFWQHVMQAWQNKGQALQDPNNPMAGVVSELQQQVQSLVQYKNQIEQQQTAYRTQQEDVQYMSQLEEMKKTYPKVDFDTKGEDGKSLEYRVLEYANENGIKNFKTAFRDFYHDELQKMAIADAQEKSAKERQKATRAGVLGKSTTPTKGITSDVRGKSYGDLEREALQELGIA